MWIWSFFDREDDMRHIDAIVMLDESEARRHADASGDTLRGSVGVSDDGKYFIIS